MIAGCEMPSTHSAITEAIEVKNGDFKKKIVNRFGMPRSITLHYSTVIKHPYIGREGWTG